MKLFLVPLFSVLTFISIQSAYCAPTDFDGNGVSDLAAVVDSLLQNGAPTYDWVDASGGKSELITSGFGAPGVLLAPGKYTQTEITEPGFISSDGTWSVRGFSGSDLSFSHGEENATFVTGTDVDGNGESDALYYTNACKHKRVEIFAKLNPAGTFQQNAKLKSGRGKYFIAFGDVDGDGSDDACSMTPGARGGKFTKNFLMICQDFLSGKVLSRFKVDKVFEPPVPVKTKQIKDVFVFAKRLPKSNQTKLEVRSSTGAKLAEVTLPGLGPVLAGHYTNTDADAEQVAVVGDNVLAVWDIGSGAVYNAAVSGKLIDEYGVESFSQDENCFCTSANIGKTKNCKRAFTQGGGAGGSEGSDGGGSSGGGSGASCGGGIRTPTGGALWKPESDHAPSPVFVSAPGIASSSCRYERTDGSVFMTFIDGGFGNPIGNTPRQHWRPASQAGCGSYPTGRVVCSNVCWSIPNPCTRYE